MFENFDLISLFILAARISPIIFISIYAIDTIVHQSLNGLIFLGGLLPLYFTIYSIGSIISWSTNISQASCDTISLAKVGRYFNIPLSIVTITYLFGTLLYSTIKPGLVRQNIFIYVFFPILILYLLYFEIRYNCSTLLTSILAIVVGGGFGAGYFAALDELKILNLDRPNIFYVNAWKY
jgi:hypothetical protein